MNLTDFFIIYLACGAPFSAYYFLHTRTENRPVFLWLKTILIFIFWMPFAVFLLRQNKNLKTDLHDFSKTPPVKTQQTDVFYSTQKQIEKLLLESDFKISIYEFREIVERYAGLILVNQTAETKTLWQEAEIYRITQPTNIELASICFSRRNRKRLSIHQTRAREDFLHLIEKLSETCSDRNKLAESSFKFVQILNDTETLERLKNMFAVSLQTEERQSVKRLEKDLWKPETHKPSPTNLTSIPLQAITATTNLRKKD